jgi:hypothetical protein
MSNSGAYKDDITPVGSDIIRGDAVLIPSKGIKRMRVSSAPQSPEKRQRPGKNNNDAEDDAGDVDDDKDAEQVCRPASGSLFSNSIYKIDNMRSLRAALNKLDAKLRLEQALRASTDEHYLRLLKEVGENNTRLLEAERAHYYHLMDTERKYYSDLLEAEREERIENDEANNAYTAAIEDVVINQVSAHVLEFCNVREG